MIRLQQGQIWSANGEFLRIVRLERLAVEYKSMLDPASKDGTHHQATKKEFCRLIKGAALVDPKKKTAAPVEAAASKQVV